MWNWKKRVVLLKSIKKGEIFQSITGQGSSVQGNDFGPYEPFNYYVTLFVWKFDTHPTPRTANSVEPYIFVTLFLGKYATLRPLSTLRNT